MTRETTIKFECLGNEHPGFTTDVDSWQPGVEAWFRDYGLHVWASRKTAGKARETWRGIIAKAMQDLPTFIPGERADRRTVIDIESANVVRQFLASKGLKAKEYDDVKDAGTAFAAFTAFVTKALFASTGAKPDAAVITEKTDANWKALIEPIIVERVRARVAVRKLDLVL